MYKFFLFLILTSLSFRQYASTNVEELSDITIQFLKNNNIKSNEKIGDLSWRDKDYHEYTIRIIGTEEIPLIQQDGLYLFKIQTDFGVFFKEPKNKSYQKNLYYLAGELQNQIPLVHFKFEPIVLGDNASEKGGSPDDIEGFFCICNLQTLIADPDDLSNILPVYYKTLQIMPNIIKKYFENV